MEIIRVLAGDWAVLCTNSAVLTLQNVAGKNLWIFRLQKFYGWDSTSRKASTFPFFWIEISQMKLQIAGELPTLSSLIFPQIQIHVKLCEAGHRVKHASLERLPFRKWQNASRKLPVAAMKSSAREVANHRYERLIAKPREEKRECLPVSLYSTQFPTPATLSGIDLAPEDAAGAKRLWVPAFGWTTTRRSNSVCLEQQNLSVNGCFLGKMLRTFP